MPHHACRNPLHCIVPPYIVDAMSKSSDPAVRKRALAMAESAGAARSARMLVSTMPGMAAMPSPGGTRNRMVYDLKGQGMWALPGTLVRQEGQGPVHDAAADEAYRHSGTVYDFFKKVHGRNSLDDRGMSLISSVHLLVGHNNAYWNGEQMVYGDGDGQLFKRFTRSLDVVAHEFTHGVVTHTCNLVYHGEPGALNESFADVFGVLVEQWKAKQTVAKADWLVGEDIMGAGVQAKALRTFKAEKAYANDPLLGTDPQPKHVKHLYKGPDDNGGVHINSGVPNHAFYRFAMALGGRAWTKAGLVWYGALTRLSPSSDFRDAVKATEAVCASLYGAKERKHLRNAWKAVGL